MFQAQTHRKPGVSHGPAGKQVSQSLTDYDRENQALLVEATPAGIRLTVKSDRVRQQLMGIPGICTASVEHRISQVSLSPLNGSLAEARAAPDSAIVVGLEAAHWTGRQNT